MAISPYSIVMALLWFTVAIGVGSFMLRKAEKYGLVFVSMVFLLAFLRGILPFDLAMSVVIRSEKAYPLLLDFLDMQIYGHLTIGQCILILWGTGIVIQLLRFVWSLIQQGCFLYAMGQEPPGSELVLLFDEVCSELGYRGRFKLSVSPQISTVYQAGFFHPHTVLPADARLFSDADLYDIFRHELFHFLGGDLWIRLGIQIMSCLLWWNPVMSLFKRSMMQLLELRCDRCACKGLSKVAQLDYLDRLLRFIKTAPAEARDMTMSYLGNLEDADVKQRFQIVLQDESPRQERIRFWGSCFICAVLFVSSYFIILQPGAMPPSIDEDVAVTVMTSENAYIVRAYDGTLLLYYENTLFSTVSEESLDVEPFCNLPIISERNNPE